MIVRDLEERDEARLRELHAASGLPYDFPDLDSPLMIVKKVVIDDEQGKPVMAATAKLLAEVGIVCDESYLTPAFRLRALELLHEAMREALAGKGIDEVVAFVPPGKKPFARRMCRSFRWEKPNFECYVRAI